MISADYLLTGSRTAGMTFAIIMAGNFEDRPICSITHASKEGGHSKSSVLHHHDFTGHEIETALIEHDHQLLKINVLNHYFAIGLITEHPFQKRHQDSIPCYGTYVPDRKKGNIALAQAGTTKLAVAGIGQSPERKEYNGGFFKIALVTSEKIIET